MKKHLKRLPAPRSWSLERKTHVWTTRPSPGPHPIEACVPLTSILRDMLGLCDTAREARMILGSREVLVDGRVVTDPKLPVGLMDVLRISRTKRDYRMLLAVGGAMRLVPIPADHAAWKLVRVEGKTTVRGGRRQLNLHDGRNVLVSKDEVTTGTTLKLAVPKQKVLATFPLTAGSTALMVGGQHAGEIAHVETVERTRNPRANVVVFREGFSTTIQKVFVIGGEAPEIALPEAPAT